MDRIKRIWYLSPMRAAKVQASLRIRAVSPKPSLLAHTSSESRETFRQKARSLVPLNGWACAVKVCHDGMFEDTNSLDGTRSGTINIQKFNKTRTNALERPVEKYITVHNYSLKSGKSSSYSKCRLNATVIHY